MSFAVMQLSLALIDEEIFTGIPRRGEERADG
jgi:hypothetical protein